LLRVALVEVAEELPGLCFEPAYQGEITLGVPV
jgi:hypothetical protein